MKRPFLWAGIYLILGIISGRYIQFNGCAVIFCALIFFIILPFFVRYKTKEIFIIPVFFVIGVFIISSSLIRLTDKFDFGENKSFTGKVVSIDYTSSKNLQLGIRIDSGSKLYVIYRNKLNVSVGDTVSLKGTALDLSFNGNFGGYDENMYLTCRKYDYKVFADFIKVIKKDTTSFNHIVYEIRKHFDDTYYKTLPKNEASLLSAMFTGIDNIDKDLRDIYSQTGIVHILAISGTHIAIFSEILFLLLNRVFKINKRICYFLLIFILLFYMFFAGLKVSILRATFMLVIGYIGKLIFKDDDAINTMSLAAILILIYEPFYLWDLGFQFSFITCTGIMMVSNILEKCCNINNFIKESVAISFAASFVSIPLCSYYFYYIPIYSVIANILILPFASLLIITAMFIGIIGFISLNAAVFLSGTAFVILKYIECVCKTILLLPNATINIGRMNLFLIILFYTIIILIYVYNKNKKLVMSLIILCNAAFIFIIAAERLTEYAEFAYIDVGQGDGAVITTNDKYAIVIDSGGNMNYEMGKNKGATAVKPYLNSKGIEKINLLFITHMDADHALGAIELLDMMEVEKVIISDYDIYDNQVYNIFNEYVEKNHVPLYTISSGDYIYADNKFKIECVYPFKDIVVAEGTNHSSLALNITYGEKSFLFTGDIDFMDEQLILLYNKNIKADVLKAAHHGSKYSSSDVFLRDVDADIFIISSGKDNTYGHPHKETLERIKERNIKYYNTAQDGAIIIKTDGKNLDITTKLERQFYE